MSTPTVKITIDPRGKPTVEVAGVSGESCVGLTAGIEAALGATAERVDKPERFEAQNQGQDHIQDQAAGAGGQW